MNFRWQAFQHTKPTADKLREWFEGSETNIGVVTGRISGLLVIDIDGDAAKTYTERVIQDKMRPDTRDAVYSTVWTQTGSGGYHILIRYNPDEFDSGDFSAGEIKRTVLWRGSDSSHSEVRLQSDGGYVVFPPSIHPNGNTYKFVRGSNIALLTKEQVLDLVRALRQPAGGKTRERKTEIKHGAPAPLLELDDEQAMDIAAIFRPHYLVGQRHDFGLYISGWLRKEGITAEGARKVIEAIADSDEELTDRLQTLKTTYERENTDEIKGYTGLLEILKVQLGSADIAREILREAQSMLPKREPAEDSEIDRNSAGTRPPSASEIAIGLVDSKAVLYFKDEYDTPHARVQVDGHIEVMPIDSTKFEHFVSNLFYYEMGKQAIKSEALNEVVRILTARTIFEGDNAKLHLRTAWGTADGKTDFRTLYYDPASKGWSCIKVTPQGWETLPRHPDSVLFTRFKQLAQVTPSRDYPADIMDRYLDLMHVRGHAARLLVKVLLAASFIPDLGHPIIVPNGEQGGVKSTFCRYHKRLVDPTAVELLTIPKDRNEFVQHMHHNYVVVYDNVRIVPRWFSDEVCKAVTGAGNSKRKLYSDDDDFAYNYKRSILVNGINNVLTEPDALDRSVMLDFTRISDEQRREEAEVDAEFDEMKPSLLGYIFDVLAKALGIKPTVKLRRKPRMADFAVWGEAIARAMGCRELEFIEAYYSVLERQNVDAVEATLIGPTIVNFVTTWQEAAQEWQGSPDALLTELRKVAEAFRIDTRDKMWPKKGNSLTRKLKPLLPDLRQGYCIDITIERDTKGEKTKSKNATWITIRKIPPQSPPPPPGTRTSGDDGSNGGGLASSPAQASPLQDVQNHARKSSSGGSGDGGDEFRIAVGPPSPQNGAEVDVAGLLSAEGYTAFDLEWTTDSTGNSVIYAAAFVDNHGNAKVLHISDFGNSERRLLQEVTQELLRHPLSLGWYSTGLGQKAGTSTDGGAKSS